MHTYIHSIIYIYTYFYMPGSGPVPTIGRGGEFCGGENFGECPRPTRRGPTRRGRIPIGEV